MNVESNERAEGYTYAASEGGAGDILRIIANEIKYHHQFADAQRDLRDIDGLDYKVTVIVELA